WSHTTPAWNRWPGCCSGLPWRQTVRASGRRRQHPVSQRPGPHHNEWSERPMANITSASFGADAFPPEVVGQIINTALEGAPIFDSLTRRTTGRGSLVFPTGDPSGFDWIGELGEI